MSNCYQNFDQNNTCGIWFGNFNLYSDMSLIGIVEGKQCVNKMPHGLVSSYCNGTLVYINNVEYWLYRRRDERELLRSIKRANRRRWADVTLHITIEGQRYGGQCLDTRDWTVIRNTIVASQNVIRNFIFENESTVTDNCSVPNAKLKELLEALPEYMDTIEIQGFVNLNLIANSLRRF